MTRAMLLILGLTLLSACSDKPAPVVDSADETPPTLPRTASVDGARVFFVTPTDGASVTSPFSVEFGLEGMDVVKAGDNAPQSGHHHLIINAELPDLSLPVPANDNYRHFGDGSSKTELTLPPGEHTLQLLLADHLHIPHEPAVYSAPIRITVEE